MLQSGHLPDPTFGLLGPPDSLDLAYPSKRITFECSNNFLPIVVNNNPASQSAGLARMCDVHVSL
jgi:hypothetical protein